MMIFLTSARKAAPAALADKRIRALDQLAWLPDLTGGDRHG